MVTKRVKAIADRISKKYGMLDRNGKGLNIVTRLNRYKIELRTELTSYEGGFELQKELENLNPDWICENFGGCIYVFYKPL